MRRVPNIPSAALRDHGGTERIERIWRRVQPDLVPGGRSVPRPSPAVWIPAMLAGVFAAGVFVGANWVRPERAPTFTAERPVAQEPAARPAAAAEPAPSPAEQPPAPQARKSRVPDPRLPAELLTIAPPEVHAPALPTPAAPAEWEQLADADRFAEARDALEARGGFSAVAQTASATQLMTLTDIARATGSRESAIVALRRVVEAFPEATVAPEAALTLGNLLEQAGDGAGAAEAYALYRRLSPSGDFAEDALARQVDSALAQGNLEALVRLVAQYENDFPNGPRLEEFRAELAKRSGAGPATEPGDTADLDEPGSARDAVLEEPAAKTPPK
jgi:TolA-binding protein